MADLGVISIFSDYWMAADDYYWDLYLPFVGRKRADTMYPLKSLFDHGVNIAVHSDFYVSKPDPLYAIYSGMTRNISKREFNERYSESKKYRRSIDPKENYTYGEVGPLSPLKERASLDSMLYASTMGGARSLFLKNEIGSIKTGKKADLVILEKNLFDVEVEEIPDVRMEMVFLKGKGGTSPRTTPCGVISTMQFQCTQTGCCTVQRKIPSFQAVLCGCPVQ